MSKIRIKFIFLSINNTISYDSKNTNTISNSCSRINSFSICLQYDTLLRRSHHHQIYRIPPHSHPHSCLICPQCCHHRIVQKKNFSNKAVQPQLPHPARISGTARSKIHKKRRQCDFFRYSPLSHSSCSINIYRHEIYCKR